MAVGEGGEEGAGKAGNAGRKVTVRVGQISQGAL